MIPFPIEFIGPESDKVDGGGIKLPKFRFFTHLQNIEFRYPDRISITIRPREFNIGFLRIYLIS